MIELRNGGIWRFPAEEKPRRMFDFPEGSGDGGEQGFTVF